MILFQELLSHSAGREVTPVGRVPRVEEQLTKWPYGLFY